MVAVGVGLVLAGLFLLVVEAHVPGGLIGTVGATALAVGVAVMIHNAGAQSWLAIPAGIALGVLGIGAVLLISRKGMAALHAKVRFGPEALIGSRASVRHWDGAAGQVDADGAIWAAQLSPGQEHSQAPAPGTVLIIDGLDGLTLLVRPLRDKKAEASWRH